MASAADADLILKLYDLRRDARMREARNWVLHTFHPKTLDELLEVQRDFGSELNQYWRQVISYWEMAAAFVLRGALDSDLFFDSEGEIIMLQARFGRFHEKYARRTRPAALCQTRGVGGAIPAGAGTARCATCLLLTPSRAVRFSHPELLRRSG